MSVDSRIGTELGGYRIERLLGRGGMSVVYLAEHLGLRRKVALKIIAAELAENERFRDRFVRESQLAASLDHPNIVPIYEAGDAEGLLFIAMRFVEGTDLKRLIAEDGPLPAERAVRVIGSVASALDAAHARGLIHRDVKPANILIASSVGTRGEEHVYLSDFGLTKHALSKSGLTGTGEFMGTIDYAAPEQFEGKPLDGRTDQYALGCVLFQALTGRVPFEREQEAAVMYAHLQEPPPKVTSLRPDLSADLDDVLATAMAKYPGRRFGSCGDMADAAAGAIAVRTRETPVPRRRLGTSRLRWIIATGVAILVVAGAGIGVLVSAGGPGPAPAPTPDRLTGIDPASGEIDSVIEEPGTPIAATAGDGAVWVANFDDHSVWWIDPSSGSHVTIELDGAPTSLAFGEGAIWVTEGFAGRVAQIDPSTRKVVKQIRVPTGSEGIAVGGGSVWVTNYYADEVLRIDPNSGGIARIPVGHGPRGIAFGEGAVWVANNLADTLTRIDPSTGEVTDRAIAVRFAPYEIAVGDGAVWVTHPLANEVSRIDPSSRSTSATIPVGRGPLGVTATDGAVWVADELDGTVSEIDPAGPKVSRTIHVGSGPEGVVAAFGQIWVTQHPV